MDDADSLDWSPQYSLAERVAWADSRLAYCERMLVEYGDPMSVLRARLLEFRALAEEDPVDLARLAVFHQTVSAERDNEGSGFGSLVAYVEGLRDHLVTTAPSVEGDG